MTRNQIEYQRNLETERSNRAEELENQRHNKVTEGETGRHNVATEGESNRHNVADETIRQFVASSTNAHYERMDQTEIDKLAETAAHNIVNELQGEAKIRYESKLGFAKLKNDLKTAIIRAGGTWGAVAGAVNLVWDEITSADDYDPFDFVNVQDKQTAQSRVPSTRRSTVTDRDYDVMGLTYGASTVKNAEFRNLTQTSQDLGTRDIFRNVTTDVVQRPSGLAPAVSTRKGTVEDMWYM